MVMKSQYSYKGKKYSMDQIAEAVKRMHEEGEIEMDKTDTLTPERVHLRPEELTAAERKEAPVYSGFIKYFPLAIMEVARLTKKGNDQHNPGKPLFWDRSKSGDELDALGRHFCQAEEIDTDDVLHATKVAWRGMANLQKLLEKQIEERDND